MNITSCMFLLALLLFSELSYSASNSKKSSSGSETKLQQITELASKSINNVITLDDETYAYYALNKPNPYSLIIFLTAAHPKFKCVICKSLDREFQLLAETYKKQMKEDNNIQKLFFLRLDYESSSQIFLKYDISSVPIIFHIGGAGTDSSSLTSSSTNNEGKEYHILIRDKFQIPSEIDAESMVSFIKDRTGIHLSIKRSQVMAYVMLLILFAGIAACVKPVINSLDTVFLPMIRYKPLWAVVSLGVYTCAISGLIFDIIRNPQM